MSLKDFKILSKLGEGAYSSVYKVIRTQDNLEYALKKVKLMNLSEKEKQNALNEVRILASIRHPNIIQYKEAFIDENSNSLCICMEYSNNGDLFQRICDYQKKQQLFSEQEIWNIFIQLVKGLKALHDLRIFHRDLKSANVFLNKDGTVKLGDMNVSKVAKKGLLYTQTGTPYYASPEVWKDLPYDSKSDIWSLGCVLYEMTTLKPPFRAEDMEGLFKKVIRGYYPRIQTHFSSDLSNIIRALLQVAPHLRPSAEKLLSFPQVIKRVNDSHLLEVDEGVPFLLNTIRIPKNLSNLTERMPKPNYSSLKIKKVEKHKFLQTTGQNSDHKSQQDHIPSLTEKGSGGILLPKLNHKRQDNHRRQPQQHPKPQSIDNEYQSELGGDKDSSIVLSPNKGKQGHVNQNHHRSKEELPDIKSNGSQVNQKYQNNENKNYRNPSNQGKQPKKMDPLEAQKRQREIRQQIHLQESENAGQVLKNKNHSIHKQPEDLDRSNISHPHHHNNENQRQVHHSPHQHQPSPVGKYQRYESENMNSKNSELRKVLDIQSIKHDKYDILNDRSNIHQIYKTAPKRRYDPKSYLKKNPPKHILDIEGESKPLMQKQRKNHQHIPGDDILKDDNKSRLPQIGSRLPKLGNGSSSQDSKMLPIIHGQGKMHMQQQDKDAIKIREISKAYKANIGHLDELKERYRQIKRMEQQKKDKYRDYMSSKNQSLPHGRVEKVGGYKQYNQYGDKDQRI